MLDNAEKTIFDIANKRIKHDFVPSLIFGRKKHFNTFPISKSHAKGITGIPSGYKKFDQMTSGFQKGDFIVLAARPSMEKQRLRFVLPNTLPRQGIISRGFFA